MNQTRAFIQRRSLSICIAILSAALLCNVAWAQQQKTPPPVADEATQTNLAIVAATRGFAVDLYKELARDEANAGKNIAFAPLSLSSGLSILAEGARNRTADQINVVLRYSQALRSGPAGEGPAVPINLLPVHRMMGWLNQQVRAATPKVAPTTSPGDALVPEEILASRVIAVDQGFPLRPAFAQTIASYYGADALLPVDFHSNADAARLKLNSTIEMQTSQRFKDVLAPAAFDSNARMVFSSAVGFKGGWMYPFSRADTRRALFRIDPKRDQQSWMMRNSNLNTWYSETGQFQAIALPLQSATFGKPDMTLVVILQRRADGLQELEELMLPRRLDEWMSAMSVRPVDVMLPQFKLSADYNLTKQLTILGMRDAFSSTAADFTGIADASSERLSLAGVIQKTELNFVEEGSDVPPRKTGGGATGLESTAVGRESRPAPFRADHPFIFMIYHHPTGSILTMGRVTTPVLAG